MIKDELRFWERVFVARMVHSTGGKSEMIADALDAADLAIRARRDAIAAWGRR